MSFVARGGAWKLYATPPVIRNSTPCWFNNAKNSAKSLFTVRPCLSPHLLPYLEALAAAEREPVVEIDLLGDLEVLGDSQHALHGRIVLGRRQADQVREDRTQPNGNAQESNALGGVGGKSTVSRI